MLDFLSAAVSTEILTRRLEIRPAQCADPLVRGLWASACPRSTFAPVKSNNSDPRAIPNTIQTRRGTIKLRRQTLHHLISLIARQASHSSDPSIWPGLRGLNVQDFTFNLQSFWPIKFTASADDTAGERQASFDQRAHADRSSKARSNNRRMAFYHALISWATREGREMHDAAAEILETRVPARLDRLPWGRFHTLVVAALGITWVLDGLEVTLAGSIAGALEASPRLRFTASDIGLASSFYLADAVIGALGFGWMTDRLGRRLLFFITLGLYLISTTGTAFAWNLESFCLFRMLTGAGIGGEYSAVNSTIQEMLPARYRGWTDLAINGSFWIGGALGPAASIFVLDPTRFDPDIGWRLAFFIGSAIGLNSSV